MKIKKEFKKVMHYKNHLIHKQHKILKNNKRKNKSRLFNQILFKIMIHINHHYLIIIINKFKKKKSKYKDYVNHLTFQIYILNKEINHLLFNITKKKLIENKLKCQNYKQIIHIQKNPKLNLHQIQYIKITF